MINYYGLRGKLLLMLVVPLVFILGGLSFYTYNGSYKIISEQTNNNIGYVASSYSNQINSSLKEKEVLATALSSVLSEQDLNNEELILLLKQLKNSSQGIKSAFVGYENMRYADSDGITEKDKKNYDTRSRDWYKTALNLESVGYTDVYIETLNKRPCVSIVKKL